MGLELVLEPQNLSESIKIRLFRSKITQISTKNARFETSDPWACVPRGTVLTVQFTGKDPTRREISRTSGSGLQRQRGIQDPSVLWDPPVVISRVVSSPESAGEEPMEILLGLD